MSRTLTVVGVLVGYTLVAGAVGAVQLAKRQRAERIRRWNNVFIGGGSFAA